jgi:hypothetical protein
MPPKEKKQKAEFDTKICCIGAGYVGGKYPYTQFNFDG